MNCFWKELTLVVDVIPDVVVMAQRSCVPDVVPVLLFPDEVCVPDVEDCFLQELPDVEQFHCFCYCVAHFHNFSLEILPVYCSVDCSLCFFLVTLQEDYCCYEDYFRNYVEEQFLCCVDCCTQD